MSCRRCRTFLSQTTGFASVADKMATMGYIIRTFVLFCFLPLTLSASENVTVSLPMGKVEGKKMTVVGHEINAFFGIPFAKPPLGDLRYKKPVALERFPGNKTTHVMPPACFQINPFVEDGYNYYKNLTMSEDCLYLNLWVPRHRPPNSEPMAVLVWIYGGGYTQGSTRDESYKGEVLAAFGKIIVASMNYRVGAMGFLNGGIRSEPGNLGLYDQVLALKWIKNNIGYFGGNPGDVTIFGESAGGLSVGFHLISPLSKGLFQRAILQSGVPNIPILYNYEESLVPTQLLAKYAGCATTGEEVLAKPEAVLECLRTKSAVELSKAEYRVSKRNRLYHQFQPIPSEDFPSSETSAPLSYSYANDVDIIIGITKDEGSTFIFTYFPDLIAIGNFTKSVAYDAFKEFLEDVGGRRDAENILGYYLRGVGERDFINIKRALSDLLGDWMFRCPSYHFANFFSARHNHVFFYYFTQFSKYLNVYEDSKWLGVMHYQDVQYVFGHPFKTRALPFNVTFTEEEEEFSLEMMELWSSFAKYGVPRSKRHYTWPTYSPPAFLSQELNATHLGIIGLPKIDLCHRIWKEPRY